MNNFTHFIGIDSSKKTLDVCVLEGKKVVLECRVMNTERGLKAVAEGLKKHGILIEKALFCCENTGLYNSNLLLWASKNAYKIWLENPLSIKKSIGMHRGKNDKIDAYRIALYSYRFKDQFKLWEPKQKTIAQLKDLMTLRKRLLKAQNKFLVPLQESALFLVKKEQKELENCSKKALKGIKESLRQVEKKIKELTLKDAAITQLKEIITSVDGVGWVTALSLIVATNGFTSIKLASKLACYAGLVPFDYQSGTSVRGRNRVSHLANKELKTLLHMSAMSAIRNSDELKAYYQRKVKEGKAKMLVINAVRNKLVLRICACVRDGRKYEKSYVRKVA